MYDSIDFLCGKPCLPVKCPVKYTSILCIGCVLFECRWICHVDDDMYVNVEQLINMLSIFTDGQPVYFGRSGTFPGALRTVLNGNIHFL